MGTPAQSDVAALTPSPTPAPPTLVSTKAPAPIVPTPVVSSAPVTSPTSPDTGIATAANSDGCIPNTENAFTGWLAVLRDHIGADTMGNPVECLHAGDQPVDMVQRTTTGLASGHYPDPQRTFGSNNQAGFTNGFEHWRLTYPVPAANPLPLIDYWTVDASDGTLSDVQTLFSPDVAAEPVPAPSPADTTSAAVSPFNRAVWVGFIDKGQFKCSMALFELADRQRRVRLGVFINYGEAESYGLRLGADLAHQEDTILQQAFGPPPPDLEPIVQNYRAAIDEYAVGLRAEADGLDSGDSSQFDLAASYFRHCDQSLQRGHRVLG